MYQCERYLNQTNGRLGEQSDQVRVFLPFNTLRYVTGIVAAYMCIKYLVFYRCMLPLYQRLLEYVRNRKKLLNRFRLDFGLAFGISCFEAIISKLQKDENNQSWLKNVVRTSKNNFLIRAALALKTFQEHPTSTSTTSN